MEESDTEGGVRVSCDLGDIVGDSSASAVLSLMSDNNIGSQTLVTKVDSGSRELNSTDNNASVSLAGLYTDEEVVVRSEGRVAYVVDTCCIGGVQSLI